MRAQAGAPAAPVPSRACAAVRPRAAERAPAASGSSASRTQLGGRLGHVGSAHSAPGASNTRRGSRAGTSRNPTRAAQSGVHEIHVAGPAGGDHRAAEQHRLGRHQAEPLAAMQRQHDVAARR